MGHPVTHFEIHGQDRQRLCDFYQQLFGMPIQAHQGATPVLAIGSGPSFIAFGGGTNAFSRYENGKTKPPLALVKLLMVLDRHPDLLNEVRAGR